MQRKEDKNTLQSITSKSVIKRQKLFQLPLKYRQKGSIAGMTLWIDRAEMLFQQNIQKSEAIQKELITWWFPKSQKWKKQTASDPG